MKEIERKLLPTPEEIKEMAIEDVKALEEDVEIIIENIKTDLEFGEGDDDWYQRALSALKVHQFCYNTLRKRLKDEGRGEHFKKVNVDKEKQILKKQKKASNSVEMQRIATDNNKIKAEAHKIAFFENTSYMHLFHGISYKKLPPEVFEEISKLAKEKQLERMVGDLKL